MLYQKIPWSAVAPKVYLLGFPKSGLHLVELMVQKTVSPCENTLGPPTWNGNLIERSFTLKEHPNMAQKYWVWSLLKPNEYQKGHSTYTEEVAGFLHKLGMSVIFIYRDLRDVAVSQAHQSRTRELRFPHPAKEFFQMMNFDDTLTAVIEGVGAFPGLIERWEAFAPWMDCDWVLPLNFEEMKNEPHDVAKRILEYFLTRTAPILGIKLHVDGEEAKKIIDEMVEARDKTDLSVTFRKGNIGEWKERFNDDHKKLFKKLGGGKWLIKLGYEEDEEW